MATAVSEPQQTAVQSIESSKLSSQQIMHNGGSSADPTNVKSNVKEPRIFGMSTHQFTPQSDSGHPTDPNPPSSPKDTNDSNDDIGHRPPYPPNKMLGGVRPMGGAQPMHPSMYPSQPQQPQQPQYLSGHRISQQSGPTPTLNQLLQTSNTIRMPNSVPTSTPSPYPQNWQHQTQNPLYPPHQSSNASNSTNSQQVYGNPASPFVHRPPQSSTPNTNVADSVDLAGQNSNDSFSGVAGAGGSGGGAPGTPNSQGMRPSPSPTGSTGSRSMSPAVGQQNSQMPPRPSSSQSDGSGPTRMSHSPMATQGGGYQQGPPPPPPHMAGYKISGSGPPPAGPATGPQPAQGNYGPVRAPGNMQYSPNQIYGAQNNPGGPNTNNISAGQYAGRPMPNHFPGYQTQPWNATSNPGGAAGPTTTPLSPGPGNKNAPPVSQPQPSSSPLLHGSNSQSPRPSHYLKTHLQHKMGFGAAASPGPPGAMTSHSPPQGYPGMGPPNVGMHHSMGPPTMGPHGHMGPPIIGQANNYEGPMPPPSSTPNSHIPVGSDSSSAGTDSNVDNGITTTAASNVGTHVTPSGTPSVTSVVTTGPDGTTIDEGSQQSTLSNASVASGEDPQCSTPKSRKNDLNAGGPGHYSHPATPQSTVPSPGAASMNSMHADEYDISSPSWPRTPASPVFNSHVSQPETYRSKKSDSLSKLYEMDDSPDRRSWLDKLLGFMEERRTPITTCPTISKNPLDLFRLYLYVKERGGFMERHTRIEDLSKNEMFPKKKNIVTKNKTWKDIAGMLGIGASSSAAYTLRRHYTKNLLAFECKFDRGGIDPQPIINQVEGTTKKKGVKASSIPSPGSSNSQDSFPAPGSSGASLDGYGGYGYPPSSQTNAPSPHPSGAGQPNVLNHQQGNSAVTGDNISVSNPFDDGASGQAPRYGAGPPQPPQHGPSGGPPFVAGGSPRPQGMPQGYTGQPGYNQYPGSGTSPDPYQTYPNNSNYSPSSRGINYPPYSPDTERSGYPPSSNMTTNLPPTNTNSSVSTPGADPYNRYAMNTSSGPGGPVQSFPRQPGYGLNTNPPSSQPNAPTPPGGNYNQQSEYYRNDGQNYPGGSAPSQTSPVGGSGNQVYGNGKAMPPPTTQPRRHPDFAKDPQYPYNPPKPPMYGWPNNQFRGQYAGPQGPTSGPPTGQWSQGNVPPRGPVAGPPGGPNVPSTTNSGSWQPEHRYSSGSASNTGATTYPPSQPGQPQWNSMPPSPNVGSNSGLRPSMMGPRAPYRPEGKPPFNMPPPQVLNKSSPAPGGMATSSYTQQPLPKREITFPPDSVEAASACFYRRKRLTRSDVAPVDAWRIVMSLRSGLLSETTWALDVLNVLLFDDSAVAYFGLSHLPGLLDILLEHFQRSLTDMFESTEESESKVWYEAPRKRIEPVDLGGVTNRIDANDHQVLLTNTPNYNLATRKGAVIKVIPKDDEIFVLDNHRDWDPETDERRLLAEGPRNFEPWQLSCSNIGSGYQELTPNDHILKCFQAEFRNVPFVKLLRGKNKTKERSEEKVKKLKVECEEEVGENIKTECEESNGDNQVEKEINSEEVKIIVLKSYEVNNQSIKVEKSSLSVNDLAGVLKRRRMSDFEDEPFSRDDPSLCLITESQEALGRRCICISTILRNLTFIPGNELEFARNPTFLGLLGKLLSLHHEHPVRTQKTRNYDREEDADFADSCSSLQGETFWWWDYLMQVRENVLVAIANIAGHIDLEPYDEPIARPILDGLLHWAICPSAHGQDPFPNNGPFSMLSPQRLALESLCKLCVTDANVDLVIATPPFSRLQRLCSVLTKLLCRSEEQVLREFAVNLLHYLSAASSAMARSIALQSPCVSLLVSFIEQAETSALSIANQHGIGALRENPDSMGTSLDMLRRAAHTLLNLAKHFENRPLFIQQEQRLLSLAMSQILDQQVANIISSVLFECSIPYSRTLLS